MVLLKLVNLHNNDYNDDNNTQKFIYFSLKIIQFSSFSEQNPKKIKRGKCVLKKCMSCDDVKILIMKIMMMFFVFVFVEWFYLKGEGIMINLLVVLCLGKYDSPSSRGGGL